MTSTKKSRKMVSNVLNDEDHQLFDQEESLARKPFSLLDYVKGICFSLVMIVFSFLALALPDNGEPFAGFDSVHAVFSFLGILMTVALVAGFFLIMVIGMLRWAKSRREALQSAESTGP